MEKLITIYPHKSDFKDMFKDFDSILSSFLDHKKKKWHEYQDGFNFATKHYGRGGDFPYQNWKGMYDNVPEAIELWTIRGADFGLDEAIPFNTFSRILKGRKFISPPFGTGLWLPEEFAKQNIYFEGKLYVFAPIKPSIGKEYKSVQIVLERQESFQEGKIFATLEPLRPTENLLSASLQRVVQKVLD